MAHHSTAALTSATNSSRLSIWLHRSTLWLFHSLLFVTPFLFTFVTDELFEFNKMIFVYGMTALIAGTWVARSIVEKRLLFQTTPLDWAIFAFFGSQLLATILSIHLHTSIFGYYSRFHGGLLSTLSYIVLFYVFVSSVTKKQLTGFLLTLLLSASLASLYAIPEHFRISPSCWLLDYNLTTNCWSENTNPKYRIFGTFGQPNWLAAYLSMIAPVALVIAVSKKWSVALRSIAVVAVLTAWIALLFTKSRSGMLGFGSALLILSSGVTWLWLKEKKPPFLSTISLKITAVVLSAVVLAALFFGTPFSPSIPEFLSRTTNPDGDIVASNQVPQPLNRLEVGGTDSGEIRRIVWQGAFDVWRRYPVFGSGVETFAYSYYLDRPTAHNLVSEWDFLYNKAHNEFLNFLATTGVVGAGTYVAMLGMMGWVGVRVVMSARSAPADRALSLGLLAGIAALSTTNFFGFSTVTVSVLLFLFAAWLVIVASDQDTVLKQAAQTPVKSTSQRNSLAWWQKAGLLATSLVTLFFLNQVHTYWQADRLFAEGKKYIGAGYLAHGLQLLTTAVQRSPAEAVFYNELGEAYAQAALTEAQSGSASTAAQLAEASVINHTTAINLNAHHLNFYKAYTQSLIRMSPLEPKLLEEARFVLEKARTLAPTDPRLSYNLHLVEDSLGNPEKSLEYLHETIELKPNYASARVRLGKYFLEQQEYASASAEFSYILTYIAPDDASVQTLLEQAQASSSAESAKK